MWAITASKTLLFSAFRSTEKLRPLPSADIDDVGGFRQREGEMRASGPLARCASHSSRIR